MDPKPKTAEPSEPHRQIKSTGRRLLPWFGVFAAAVLLACAIGSWSGDSNAAEVAKTVAFCAAVAASTALFAVLILELQRRMRERQFALAAGTTLGTLAFGAALGKCVELVFHPGISQGVTEFLYCADFVVLTFVAILIAAHLLPLIKTVGIACGAGMIFTVLIGLYSVSRLFWENETPWDRKQCKSVVRLIESGKLVEEKDFPGMVLLPPQQWAETGIPQVFVTHLPAGRLYFFQMSYRHGGFRRGYVYSAVPYEKLYVQKDNAGNDSTMINVGMEEFPHEMIIQPTQWAEWFHTPGSAEMNDHPRQNWQPDVPGLELSLSLSRFGGGYVAASVMVTHATGTPTPAVRVKLFDVKAKEKPLVEFRTGDNVAGQSKNVQEIETTDNKSKIQYIHELIELKKGSKVQAELLAGEKSQFSPTFEPE